MGPLRTFHWYIVYDPELNQINCELFMYAFLYVCVCNVFGMSVWWWRQLEFQLNSSYNSIRSLTQHIIIFWLIIFHTDYKWNLASYCAKIVYEYFCVIFNFHMKCSWKIWMFLMTAAQPYNKMFLIKRLFLGILNVSGTCSIITYIKSPVYYCRTLSGPYPEITAQLIVRITHHNKNTLFASHTE